MTDRVFPSSKPTNGSKPQLHNNPTRPPYRPSAYHNRRRRSLCCSCCLWSTLVILLLLFLTAIAGAVLYVLYRPHRPSFSLSSLHISHFNLTTSSPHFLSSHFNLTLTTRNPNKKITFFYTPIALLLTSSNHVLLGNASFPAFTHPTKNTTTLKTTVSQYHRLLDDGAANKLKITSLALKIRLDTKVKVKIGGMKSKKVRIRVHCGGIQAHLPLGKTATKGAKCKAHFRIKIWKFTF